jgi:hypothetical protein
MPTHTQEILAYLLDIDPNTRPRVTEGGRKALS